MSFHKLIIALAIIFSFLAYAYDDPCADFYPNKSAMATCELNK